MELAWLLYSKGKSLNQQQNPTKRVKDALKYAVKLMKLQLEALLKCLSSDLKVNLPFKGHVCLPVSNGYKIFDLEHDTVVKLFSSQADTAVINKEVELNLKVRSLNLGSLLQDWSVDERWYKESYVNSHHLKFTNWAVFSGTLHQRLIPLISQIILAAPAKSKNLLEYSNHLRDTLFSESGKLSNRSLDPEKIEKIKFFWDTVSNKLESFAKIQPTVVLTLTHGDLSLLHVLDQPGNDVMIDWEYMNYRSAVFDLYHIFFQEWTHRKPPASPINLAGAVASLESQLHKSQTFSQQDVSNISISTDLYRWLYYIEHICQALEMSTPTDRKLDYILGWIEGFMGYEEKITNIMQPH
jgi:thiamine kinase-like enzyme